ncbi:MAG: carnitine-CoA ligase [Subtercola sp.]|nr:carnitine-CoA ligase [Subtercola sp.]
MSTLVAAQFAADGQYSSTLPYDTGADRTAWTLGREWAARRPNETVIVDAPDAARPEADTSISWERLMTDSSELRRRLAAIGVVDQRTVVFSLPNSPLTVALWLAIMSNDAIVQAIDVESGVVVFERALQATDPVAVIVVPLNAPAAREALARTGSTARLIVLENTAITGGGQIDGLGALGIEPGDPSADAIAALLPTSGTSGLPKLVELTSRNYVYGAERLARNSGYVASDRHYLCSPFFHTNAQVYLVMPPFLTGGSMVVTPRFSATHYFSLAARTGVTVSSMVAPPLRLALHKAIETGRPVEIGDFRLIQYGMTLSAADWVEWERLVPSIQTRQVYGQTESVTGVLGGSPWEPDDRKTIGRPWVGVEAVRIVGEHGEDVPDGEPGEIWVAGVPGATLMQGYRNAPEATRETLVDGVWLRTGDVMVRHPGGRFEFRGRRMHIIRRGGENISTYALEIDLQACPLVSDVAVTARDDARLDSLVIAHVIPGADYSEKGFLA